ncbi:MAG: aspartate aminotransferase family protein [Proteobacteria bacterium]|nr:aspartate aminotransferase family protein [Pseudomonadota bacterium]
MPTYGSPSLAFERGEGAYLYSTEGRRYLDFASGIAVTALGHAHSHLVKALTEQVAKFWHCSNLYRIPGQERLARRLVERSFADTVFFCNSGGEAVECGLKAVRRYHDSTGNPERYRVITCTNAFHGRTLATISAGRQEKHTKGFEPLVDGFDQVPFGNLNEMRAAIGRETAAILVEPVQGEGGIRAASADYLKGLRAVADEFGLLLFFDEVQCGMGRTGRLFAHEWAGVKPDVMAVAKGIGGGFPMGACLATEAVGRHMTAGSHGSTFGGNPLACAAANAVLDVILADGFLPRVEKMGVHLRWRLEGLVAEHGSVFSEVRGRGLMLGLKCVPSNADVVQHAQDEGLLLVTAGENVVRVYPPLIVEKTQIDEGVAILDCVAAGFATPGRR